MQVAEESKRQLARFIEREKRLQRLTWISLLLPITLFVVLAVLVQKEFREFRQLNTTNQELSKDNARLHDENARLDESIKQKTLALSAVKSRHPAAYPKIVYYRSSIGNQVIGALQALGFTDIKEATGANPRLLNKSVDSLSYGCGVKEGDIQIIAAALTNANLPIREIAPAKLRTDPMLVQLTASSGTDPSAPAIDPTTWRKPPCVAN